MKNILLYSFVLFLFSSSCGNEGERVNIFKLDDDKMLGQQISSYIESDSSGIVILDTAKYSKAYSHLNRIKNVILESGKLKHKDDFKWSAKIIQNDSVINAFATPGGYIYVYTGLIKYLDNEDQFAGVIAHEIAHADRRHSTAMLTKVYGISLLMNTILGNDNEMVSRISQNLLSLSFSRNAEQDADKHSVIYLCQKNSPYKADGAAGFFEKMIHDERMGYIPEFLSSHPNPPHRITNIKNVAEQIGCETALRVNEKDYLEFKKSLP
jgi:predicted Zn-dependent protease